MPNKLNVLLENNIKKYSSCEESINKIDQDAIVNKTVTPCADGTTVIIYSIDTATSASYGITFSCISGKRTNLKIEFSDAREYWNEDNIQRMAAFIKQFSCTNESLDDIRNRCSSMLHKEYIRIDSDTYIEWDEYGSNLYYNTMLVEKG